MKFVLIDKAIEITNKDLGKITLDGFEYPQFESEATPEEVEQFFGGRKGYFEYLNAAIKTSSTNIGRAALRTLPKDADIEKAKENAKLAIRNYTPDTSSGPSKADKVNQRDQIAALLSSGEEITRERLLELMELAK